MKKLFLTLVLGAFALISFAQNVPAYVPTNGLVGWWPFNGNANDESGNGNNGTVNGATLTTDRFGQSNKAYDFDGVSDYVEVSDDNSLDLTNNYTFSVWVKIVDYSLNNSSEPQRTMLCKPRNSGGGGYSFRAIEGVDWNSDGNALPYISGWNTPSVNGGLESLQDSLDLNNWTNLVFSYDGSIARLYKNSQLVNSDTTIFSLTNSIEPLFFGKEFQSLDPLNNRWFKGKLDDIGIWNRALTQQEITDLYNGNICYQNITVTDTLLINTGITGFNPITYENTLRVWPNPTNDHITIDAGNLNVMNGYSIRITNSLGQQMFQSAINQQQFYLDLSTWTGNGMYFLNLIDPSGNIIDIKKIVLQ